MNENLRELEVLGRGWHTVALGPQPALEYWALRRLQPNGPYRGYRIGPVQPETQKALRAGLFKRTRFQDAELYVWHELL